MSYPYRFRLHAVLFGRIRMCVPDCLLFDMNRSRRRRLRDDDWVYAGTNNTDGSLYFDDDSLRYTVANKRCLVDNPPIHTFDVHLYDKCVGWGCDWYDFRDHPRDLSGLGWFDMLVHITYVTWLMPLDTISRAPGSPSRLT